MEKRKPKVGDWLLSSWPQEKGSPTPCRVEVLLVDEDTESFVGRCYVPVPWRKDGPWKPLTIFYLYDGKSWRWPDEVKSALADAGVGL